MFESEVYRGQESSAKGSYPKLKPNCPFMYMHNPRMWSYQKIGKKWCFLPILNTLYEQAGVNGVELGGVGQPPNMEPAIARFRKQGYDVFLDQKMGYCKRIRVGPKSYHHADQFFDAEMLGDRLIVSTDVEGRNKWLFSLVKDGHIKPPHQYVATLHRTELERRLERLTKTTTNFLGRDEQIKALQEQIDGIEPAWRALQPKSKEKTDA